MLKHPYLARGVVIDSKWRTLGSQAANGAEGLVGLLVRSSVRLVRHTPYAVGVPRRTNYYVGEEAGMYSDCQRHKQQQQKHTD